MEKEEDKLIKWLKRAKFFRIGFYGSVFLWALGLILLMIFEASIEINLIVSAILLCVYSFFVIGRSIVMNHLRNELQHLEEEQV